MPRVRPTQRSRAGAFHEDTTPSKAATAAVQGGRNTNSDQHSGVSDSGDTEQHAVSPVKLTQSRSRMDPQLAGLICKLCEKHTAPPHTMGCAAMCICQAANAYAEASQSERESWTRFEDVVVDPTLQLQLRLNSDQCDLGNEHTTMTIVRIPAGGSGRPARLAC